MGYESYVGKSFRIVRPVYEDIDDQSFYDEDGNPDWNYEGNIVTVTNFYRFGSDRGMFHITFKGKACNESLMVYDFENGFLELVDDPEDDVIEDDIHCETILCLL